MLFLTEAKHVLNSKPLTTTLSMGEGPVLLLRDPIFNPFEQ